MAEKEKKSKIYLQKKHHMTIHWHTLAGHDDKGPACEAPLSEKATLVGRIGLMMLSIGTGAWRVREFMNYISRALHISCSADVGLLNINLTCFDGTESITEALALRTSGVNTDKLMEMELFVRVFDEKAEVYSVDQFHTILDDIERKPGNYTALRLGLAAGLACGAFTFLLGGGVPEMLCAFLGAGVGQFIRKKMIENRITLIACIAVSVAAACLVYAGAISLAIMAFKISSAREAGYICSMLFVIPGFPLITGGIDMVKLDMRSGFERLLYALLIISTATMTGWVTALIIGFEPSELISINLSHGALFLCRLAASFCGVYGFSLMFNSPRKMAATAGLIGLAANTLRLSLVDYCNFPIGGAAFIGAFSAGLLASLVKRRVGFPRISLTVPSIVIMVPGLYMYRGIYSIALTNIGDGSLWLTKAVLLVMALPLGLAFARICTDSRFRHST